MTLTYFGRMHESLFPLVISYMLQGLFYLFFPPLGYICYGIGTLTSLNWRKTHGEPFFSKHVESGPFRVGFRDLKIDEIDCSIYYPAKNDESGKLGVQWVTYGMDQVDGKCKFLGFLAANPDIKKWVQPGMTKSLKIKMPVFAEANLGLEKMQLVIFSHSLFGNR